MATVLLTGAIRPAAVPLVLADPRERLLDTLCAIRCWLDERTVDRLVYYDGSGVLLPAELFDPLRFTALACDFGDGAQAHGKGRAEASIIVAAARSGLLGAGFYKATGRLYVENFAEIDRALDPAREFCTVPGGIRVPTRVPRLHRMLRAVETTFFWVRTDFFLARLAPLTGRIDDSSETTFIETIYATAARGRSACRLEPRPLLVGRSASRGRAYRRDFADELRAECALLLERVPLGGSGGSTA